MAGKFTLFKFKPLTQNKYADRELCLYPDFSFVMLVLDKLVLR